VQDGVDLGIDGIDDGVEIGSGGFGVVFRALQIDRGRTIAVRLLPARPEAALRRRYARECELLRALSAQPNLVTLIAAGFTTVDQPYLAMDYMPNGSLADRIERDGRVPWSEAVTIVAKLADALAVAHAAGIQHRDIRPENVLIASSGEPCLADLGLSRLLDVVEARPAPVSLLHAAPEVVEGRRPSDASDVYSLGSTLFTMLSGSPAFPAGPDEAMNAVLGRIAKAPVPDLRRRGVPDAVCDVVEAAMAKNPAKRPGSAVALGDQLRAALEPGAARPAAPRMAPPPFVPDPPVTPPPTPKPAPEFRAAEAPPASEPVAEIATPQSLPTVVPPTPPPAGSEPDPTAVPPEPEPEPGPSAHAAVPEPGPDPVPPEPQPAPTPVPEPAPDPVPPEPEPAPAPPEPAPAPVPPEPAPTPEPPAPPVPAPVPEPEPAPGPQPGPVPTALAGSIVPHPPAPGEAVPEHHLDPLVPSEPHAPAIEVAPTPPPVVPGWRRPRADPTPDATSDATPEPETSAATPATDPATDDSTTGPSPEAPTVVPSTVGGPAPETTPDADAPDAISTEPILIEGDPDESSRRRGRLVRFGLGALVALVSLVVLVMVILDSTRNDAGTPTTAQQVPTGPSGSIAPPRAEPLSLPTILMPSGMVVARTWALEGDEGDELVASVDISNPTDATKSDQILEVIPKSLAANVSQVKFEGATPVVVRADPIVRFDVTLAPGQRTRIGYRIAVPAEGSDPDRLDAWNADRQTEQEAFDAVLNLTIPKGQIKPGG
jgi:serine/threonine protein kinase